MSEAATKSAPRTLVLNSADNVAVALSTLDVGAETPEGFRALKRVPKGHKYAIQPIDRGAPVVKFGQIIGFAKEDIPPGDWVHEHNCGVGESHGAFERDYAFCEGVIPVNFVPEAKRATFEGYLRPNGGRHPQLRGS